MLQHSTWSPCQGSCGSGTLKVPAGLHNYSTFGRPAAGAGAGGCSRSVRVPASMQAVAFSNQAAQQQQQFANKMQQQQQVQRPLWHQGHQGHQEQQPHCQQHWQQQQQQPVQLQHGQPQQHEQTQAPENSLKHQSSSSSSSSSRRPLHALLELLRSQPARHHPSLLTSAIKATGSWQEAAQLFSDTSPAFNHIHTAAMISHLPKVLRRQQPLAPHEQRQLQQLLQDLSVLAEAVLHDCSGRELVNMAHGFAATGFYSRRLMQLLLGRCNLKTLKPQELSNLTWAVAKLNHETHEGWVSEVLGLSQRYMSQDRFKPQEMCNIAWGLAVLQRQCLLSSAPPLRHVCTHVDVAWKAGFCTSAETQIQSFKAPDVAMGLWALAVLGFSEVEQQWLDQQLGRAVAVMGDMQARHIATVLWAVSQMQRQQQQQQGLHKIQQGSTEPSSTTYSSSSSLQQFGGACFPRLQHLLHQPQQQQQQQQLQLACVVLLSTARLQLRPPAAAVEALLAAAAVQLLQYSAAVQQQVQPGFTGLPSQQLQQKRQQIVRLHDVTTLLYSMARLSYQPSRQFMAAAGQAVACACWQQAIANSSTSSYSKGHCSSTHHKQGWQHHKQQQTEDSAAAAAAAVKGKELALLVWSMAKLYYQPAPGLIRLLLKASAAQLDSFSASDVGLLLWGLARMRACLSYSWLRRMLRHFLARVDDGINTAPDICNVVHALLHLPGLGGENLKPVLVYKLGELLPLLAAAAQQRFDECGPRELVQLVQGFAGLGWRPGGGWLLQLQQRCQEVGFVRFDEREQAAWLAAVAQLELLPEQALAEDTAEQQQQQEEEEQEGLQPAEMGGCAEQQQSVLVLQGEAAHC